MSAAERVRSEEWRERAPNQRARILADLRGFGGWRADVHDKDGWVCSLVWHQSGILRAGARVWELRHRDFHRIEERICAIHRVAEYRLVRDADKGL